MESTIAGVSQIGCHAGIKGKSCNFNISNGSIAETISARFNRDQSRLNLLPTSSMEIPILCGSMNVFKAS